MGMSARSFCRIAKRWVRRLPEVYLPSRLGRDMVSQEFMKVVGSSHFT